MKHQLLHLLSLLLFLFAIVSLVGCYTQFGTVRSDNGSGEERDKVGQADEGYQSYDDTTEYTDNGQYSNDDYWYDRNQVGFAYYYPMIHIGASYYDPWYYGRWGWYSYYDPFICGTAYPWLYAGYYYPSVWDNYPWYFGNGYRGGYSGGRAYGTTRTFGNTRGGGNTRTVGGTRGNEGTYQAPPSSGDLPVGYRSGATSDRSGATPSVTPKVSTGKRGSNEGQRSGSRTGTVSRAGKTRGSGTREGARIGRSGSSPSQPQSVPRGSGGSNRGGGERSGGGRTYSPPPSAPHSSPAPAPSGGSAPSNSGSRGGGRR